MVGDGQDRDHHDHQPGAEQAQAAAQPGDQAEREGGEVVGDLVLGDLVRAQPDDRQHAEEAEPEAGADRGRAEDQDDSQHADVDAEEGDHQVTPVMAGEVDAKVKIVIATRSAAITARMLTTLLRDGLRFPHSVGAGFARPVLPLCCGNDLPGLVRGHWPTLFPRSNSSLTQSAPNQLLPSLGSQPPDVGGCVEALGVTHQRRFRSHSVTRFRILTCIHERVKTRGSSHDEKILPRNYPPHSNVWPVLSVRCSSVRCVMLIAEAASELAEEPDPTLQAWGECWLSWAG